MSLQIFAQNVRERRKELDAASHPCAANRSHTESELGVSLNVNISVFRFTSHFCSYQPYASTLRVYGMTDTSFEAYTA